MNQHLGLAGLATHVSATDWIGYLAAVLVLATFSVTSMRTLRCIAILSNIAFISYGAVAGLLPILLLHSVLLPTNLIRLLQLESRRRSQRVPPRAAAVSLATAPVLRRSS